MTRYMFSIPENQEVNTTVGIVTATDVDITSAYSKVFYRFKTSNSHFSINTTSGMITLIDKVDREATSVFELLGEAFNKDENGSVVMVTEVKVI